MKRHLLLALLVFLCVPFIAQADDGALLDPNTAETADLQAAGLDAAVAEALVAARPLADIEALDAFLTSHELTREEITAVYGRLFLPIDLNTASNEAILLIPGVGKRMAHEFEEYRPYVSIEQFRKEIGKYVDEKEVARLERYVMIAAE